MSISVVRQIPIDYIYAQYFNQKYGELNLNKGVGRILKHFFTTQKEDACVIDNEPTIKIRLSHDSIYLYPNKNLKTEIQSIIRDKFWSEAISSIAASTINIKNISECIRQFYLQYNIDENYYDNDSFRRVLNRKGIKYNNHEIQIKTVKKFRKLSKTDCIEIARAYYIRNISLRQIASQYGVHHKSISDAKNKYKKVIIRLSEDSARTRQIIHSKDKVNQERFCRT